MTGRYCPVSMKQLDKVEEEGYLNYPPSIHPYIYMYKIGITITNTAQAQPSLRHGTPRDMRTHFNTIGGLAISSITGAPPMESSDL